MMAWMARPGIAQQRRESSFVLLLFLMEERTEEGKMM